MRGARKLGSLALLALAACACDTTQPLQVDEQTFTLGMRGLGAVVPVYDVFDGFEDTDGDGTADDTNGDGVGDFFLWCKSTSFVANAGSVPFGFTVEVTILRAGETVRENITSPAAMASTLENVTEYDNLVPNIPGVPSTPTINFNGKVYKFQNGRRRSAANIEVAAATLNPLSAVDPLTYGVGNGRCSLAFWGPAVIDRSSGNAYPLTFVLGKGDTVTVKAIRASTGFPAGVPIAVPNNVALLATLSTGGRPVEVRGSFTTNPSDGPNAGLAFTFRSF